jgi:ADP-heptose:LPS heptosyltransferase/SAM-dependent methyltransferase
MRILASNPDTLGDLVLRQPLYRALIDAGHELALVVRESVLPLVPYVAPGARTLVLPYEPYANDVAEHWDVFADLFRAARGWDPEVLLIAPYRWTQFDEKLAEELPGTVRKVGMTGRLYAGDPYAGAAPVSQLRLDVAAKVEAEQFEVEKNAALCAAVIGQPPRSVDPSLVANDADLDSARGVLARLGMEPGDYWVACVGGTAHIAIKTWHAQSWGRVLAEWAKGYGRRFLLVGLPAEEPAAREVLAAMREALGSDEAIARHAAVWMEPGGTLAELLALTQLSAGYVGHDTGPMHVAAAMGKPTLAVFGGGTWPRFRPAVTPSAALLVGVPCVGCGWVCAFEQPYCIKAVPADAVLRAAADLEEGRVTAREARVVEPDEALQRRMIREGAEFVRLRVRQNAELSRRLDSAYRDREADVAALHEARAREAAERAAESQQLRAQLQLVHDEAARAAEAFAAHSRETELLREAFEARSVDAVRLAAALEERTGELGRLREEMQGMIREVDQSGGNGVHDDRAQGSPAAVDPPGVSPPGASSAGEEVAQLRAAIEQLEARVRELEPRVPLARRPMRQVLTDLVIGSRQYARRAAPHLPKVTVVTPVPAAVDAADVRATVESVLAQDYHDLEYVVVLAATDSASTQAALDMLGEYEDRIDHVLAEPGPGSADAAAKGLAAAQGDVLHLLHPGDLLEPGAVLRVAEYFGRRRGVHAAYSEDAWLTGAGWKFPAPPQPTPDVASLLREQYRTFRNGVFFRRWAYSALGAMKAEFGAAAEWELWLRLARRFGLRRMPGHFRTIFESRFKKEPEDFAAEAAAEAFEKTFGLAGRIRCRAINLVHRWRAALRRLLPAGPSGDRRHYFPPPRSTLAGALPRAAQPALAPNQPVSPLSGRAADRFLFSTPDTNGGDGGGQPRPLHQAYYDSVNDAALSYPPVPLERLNEMYAARLAGGAAAQVVAPPANRTSPYARYRGSVLGRLGVGDLLTRLPTPYWWFNEPRFDDPTGDELLGLLAGLADPHDASIRLLNVGCFEGALLERLKRDTRWQICGTEANATAAAAARAKGHAVWEVAPHDAPIVLPVGEAFDLIFLGQTVEHLPDPLLVLRRLRQLLAPGGLLAFDQPNLDSAHASLFGPTWGHWQIPYHRTLTGRRGVRRLASLADMRVVRLRTRTHPYPACVSVRLNDLGLAAIVPDTARFPNDVASRGVRLAGWSRMLWDWNGRGDYLYAVLKAL